MSTQRFSPKSKFVWDQVLYQVTGVPGPLLIEIESLLDGQSKVVSCLKLVQALTDGQLRFVRSDHQPITTPKISLEDYSPGQQETARYRLQVIEPLLTIPPHQRSTKDLITRVEEVKQAQEAGEMPSYPVSYTSVYRWLKAYTEGGNDIRSLIPNSRQSEADKRAEQPNRVEQIIQEVINERYFVRERVKIDDIHHEVILRIETENRQLPEEKQLSPPSRTTIWRRINELDVKQKLVAKKGKRVARSEMTQYGRMEPPKFPLERVEIDHTPTDIFVVDEDDNLPLGRLTLTFCLDVATRYPLGFYLGFEPPSYLTVAACLHHVIMPKPDVQTLYDTAHSWLACGVPNTLVVDNGREFIGKSLQDACLSLGILLQQLPVRTPHFKGAVERNFRTLNTGLFHTLPGTTFSNFTMKGDYDSLRFASLRRTDLYKLIHIFLLDIYAESFHRGLGTIPARRWEEAMDNGFLPRVPTDPDELSILLGRVDERAVQGYGIDFQSIRYNHEELALLRHRLKTENKRGGCTRVKIKYLPDNLGTIFAFDPFEQRYIEVPALNQAYAQGLTLWSHQIIRRYVLEERDRVSMKALGIAKRKIQEIVDDSKARSRKKQTRSKMARWQTGNRKSADTGTENLANLPNWFEQQEAEPEIHQEQTESDEADGWSIEE
ncbi:MAG: hypothetical protein CL608_06960 [Anaerolineaceae bacterium]|nr:hypothetical protein [Anaerolineaceae bacterium]